MRRRLSGKATRTWTRGSPCVGEGPKERGFVSRLHLNDHWLRRCRLAGRQKIRTPACFMLRRTSESTTPALPGPLVSRLQPLDAFNFWRSQLAPPRLGTKLDFFLMPRRARHTCVRLLCETGCRKAPACRSRCPPAMTVGNCDVASACRLVATMALFRLPTLQPIRA
jgi:hypothetical protein